jgi:hypothetical protein
VQTDKAVGITRTHIDTYAKMQTNGVTPFHSSLSIHEKKTQPLPLLCKPYILRGKLTAGAQGWYELDTCARKAWRRRVFTYMLVLDSRGGRSHLSIRLIDGTTNATRSAASDPSPRRPKERQVEDGAGQTKAVRRASRCRATIGAAATARGRHGKELAGAPAGMHTEITKRHDRPCATAENAWAADGGSLGS